VDKKFKLSVVVYAKNSVRANNKPDTATVVAANETEARRKALDLFYNLGYFVDQFVKVQCWTAK
jgi:hypothetical protein